MNVGVVAKIRSKEGCESSLFTQLEYLYEMTHQYDDGCIQYDLHQDVEDKRTFIFIETWQSQEYLAAHEVKEHYLETLRTIENLVESVEVNKTKRIL